MLNKTGYLSYTKTRGLDLSEEAIKSRFDWAKKHRNWTFNEWKKVYFSDESPIQATYRGKILVRRMKQEDKNDPKFREKK